MGCCQSDLKGEEQAGTDNPGIRKVATNFSTVDYDAAATGRRDTVYAPHEAERQKSEGLSPLTEKKTDPISQNIAEATTPASTSNKPQSDTDQINFENKLPEASSANPTAINTTKEVEENKPPYQDVTASPTSPTATNTIDDKLPKTPAPTPAVEKPAQ